MIDFSPLSSARICGMHSELAGKMQTDVLNHQCRLILGIKRKNITMFEEEAVQRSCFSC